MKKILMCALLIGFCIFAFACSKNVNAPASTEKIQSGNNTSDDNNTPSDNNTTDDNNTSGGNNTSDENNTSAALLTVNGEIISSDNVFINYEKDYAELPLIAIVKALGGTVELISENEVDIDFEGTRYVLNLSEKSLEQEGIAFNMLDLPPGTMHGAKYRICGDEFMVDSDCLRYFLNQLGARIKIDHDSASVEVYFYDK